MSKRGRKPKNQITNLDLNIDTPAEQEEIKKRGRRSKKSILISDSISKELDDLRANIKIFSGDDDNIKKYLDQFSTLKFGNDTGSENKQYVESNSKKNIYELKTLQTSTFKSLIESLKEILVEVNIETTPTGMKIVANDEKRGITVFLYLHSSKFEYYFCQHKKQESKKNNGIHMGISMNNFYKSIKCLNNNSTLTLYINIESPNEMGIIIDNNDLKTTTTYTMKLLDIDIKEFKFSDIKFDAVVYISSNIFQKICRDMNNIGDKITITAHSRKLILSCNDISAKDEAISQETVINESSEYMQFIIVNKDIISGYYLLKDILSFTKCSNISGGGLMKLYMKNDCPLVIEYDVGGLGTMKLCINSVVEQSPDEEENNNLEQNMNKDMYKNRKILAANDDYAIANNMDTTVSDHNTLIDELMITDDIMI